MPSPSSTRPSSFKSTMDIASARTARQYEAIQLRKSKKEQAFAARRALPEIDYEKKFATQTNFSGELALIVSASQRLGNDASFLSNESFTKQMTMLRRLSRAANCPWEDIIGRPIILHAVQFVLSEENDQHTTAQEESVWFLLNLCATKHAATLARNFGAIVDNIVRLAHHTDNERLCEYSIWCLGNMAGENIELRRALIDNHKIRGVLLNNLYSCKPKNILSATSMAAGNFLYNLRKAPPQEKCWKLFVPRLAETLTDLLRMRDDSKDERYHEVIMQICFALSCVGDVDAEAGPTELCKYNVQPLLVHVLRKFSKLPEVLFPALETLDHIVSGNHEMTQSVIDAGFLDVAMTMLRSTSRSVKRETGRIISQIACGSWSQLRQLLYHDQGSSVVRKLAGLANREKFDICREGLYTVTSLTVAADEHKETEILRELSKFRAVEAIADGIKPAVEHASFDLVERLLDATRVLLNAYSKYTLHGFKQRLENHNIEDSLQYVVDHVQDERIFNLASELLTTWDNENSSFEDDDDENTNLMPHINCNDFSFGADLSTASKQLFPGSPGADAFTQRPYNFVQ